MNQTHDAGGDSPAHDDIDEGAAPDRAGRASSAAPPPACPAASAGVSRRRLLGTAGAAGAVGVAAGAAGGVFGHAAAQPEPPTALKSVGGTGYAFHGRRQSGIVEPLQAHGHLVAFDLAPGAGRREAAALLRRWSRTAAELMAGRTPQDADATPTGIALDAGPSALTITFGLGATFFDRTGLADARPAALAPLPAFSSDALDRRRSDGDLWVQIAADDALVAFDALRLVRRQARDAARVRWHMTGFNRTPGATTEPRSQRNLMGQVDGTNNPRPGEPDFDARVFVPREGGDGRHPAWMADGSYAVVRRIRMLLDSWDELPLAGQEKVIGRRKSDGAPLSGGGETTPVDLEKRTPGGELAVAANAHVRVSAPETNGGAAMLRRSYSYQDGQRPGGTVDAGLLFVAWQSDPLRGFVPVQRKLDRGDALSAFIRHEASALFAVPPAPAEGEYVGQPLLEG
ncbi:iron uptake transporter deferrochelatase/peroxidase subunit [Streptomyces sp. WMMC1477]|uniref:iron uptake transporter deferrochelatase/peroxidase subunit n=1 Tax=Streptomyces sp. WMMC1477 TaxID=3015155 RepID=UPI0022B72FC3|nr:iron uptake transporter deferrochelatase/peroxidase subunit [Streptomyces sp. WMMC1477]MCZ7432589.1 iron uptake transporter deferrochelatase/peroxidase subunit [Streptomyces sp. WMMC1477]